MYRELRSPVNQGVERVLDVEGVHKSYGAVVALAGVDLHVAAGEVVGLVGPNGAGKTSLVSIVAGLRRADAGRVVVGGVDVGTTRDKIGRLLGLAPQELAIYPSIRVRENLTLFGELAGLRRDALRTRIDEIATALGLTDLLNRPAEALSGGQKRRLHTAMALMHRPPLLLLDEPTVGADIESRAQLLTLVRSLADEGAAIVYSTHYLPEVEQLDASVAVIDRGRVLARGALREVLATHAKAGVELVFSDGERQRTVADDPAAAAARVIADLDEGARSRLAGVELIQPTLESVYMTITGRRYDSEGEEVRDVVVA